MKVKTEEEMYDSLRLDHAALTEEERNDKYFRLHKEFVKLERRHQCLGQKAIEREEIYTKVSKIIRDTQLLKDNPQGLITRLHVKEERMKLINNGYAELAELSKQKLAELDQAKTRICDLENDLKMSQEQRENERQNFATEMGVFEARVDRVRKEVTATQQSDLEKQIKEVTATQRSDLEKQIKELTAKNTYLDGQIDVFKKSDAKWVKYDKWLLGNFNKLKEQLTNAGLVPCIVLPPRATSSRLSTDSSPSTTPISPYFHTSPGKSGEEYDRMVRELDGYKNKCTQLEQELNATKQNEDIKRMDAEAQRMQRAKFDELQRKNGELQKQNGELQKQNGELQKQNGELQQQVVHLTSVNKLATDTKQKLDRSARELSTERKRTSALKSAVETSTSGLAQLKTDLETLRSETNDLRRRQLSDEMTKLQDQLVNSVVERLEHELAKVKRKLRMAELENKSHALMKKQLDRSQVALNSENERLQEEINELRFSHDVGLLKEEIVGLKRKLERRSEADKVLQIMARRDKINNKIKDLEKALNYLSAFRNMISSNSPEFYENKRRELEKESAADLIEQYLTLHRIYWKLENRHAHLGKLAIQNEENHLKLKNAVQHLLKDNPNGILAGLQKLNKRNEDTNSKIKAENDSLKLKALQDELHSLEEETKTFRGRENELMAEVEKLANDCAEMQTQRDDAYKKNQRYKDNEHAWATSIRFLEDQIRELDHEPCNYPMAPYFLTNPGPGHVPNNFGSSTSSCASPSSGVAAPRPKSPADIEKLKNALQAQKITCDCLTAQMVAKDRAIADMQLDIEKKGKDIQAVQKQFDEAMRSWHKTLGQAYQTNAKLTKGLENFQFGVRDVRRENRESRSILIGAVEEFGQELQTLEKDLTAVVTEVIQAKQNSMRICTVENVRLQKEIYKIEARHQTRIEELCKEKNVLETRLDERAHALQTEIKRLQNQQAGIPREVIEIMRKRINLKEKLQALEEFLTPKLDESQGKMDDVLIN